MKKYVSFMCSSVFVFLVMCWLHFIIGVFIDHISIVFSASIFIKIKIAIQFSFGINYVALFLCKVKLFRVILAAFGWEPRMCGKKTLNLLGGTLWVLLLYQVWTQFFFENEKVRFLEAPNLLLFLFILVQFLFFISCDL